MNYSNDHELPAMWESADMLGGETDADQYRIKVLYFKPYGKFYSSGEYWTDKQHMYQVFEEFEAMLAAGKRPGLVDGHDGFTAVLDCSGHPMGYPACFHYKA